jgi:uncharacterized protein (DUF983 family)
MSLSDTLPDRPTRPAVLNGLRRRCPACGEGALFDGYLTVRPRCPACSEDLSHQRADDGPAYLTILLVGHLVAPLLHVVFVQFRPPPLTLALGFSALTVVLAALLLPRMKGLVVAVQWARRMHGFGTAG